MFPNESWPKPLQGQRRDIQMFRKTGVCCVAVWLLVVPVDLGRRFVCVDDYVLLSHPPWVQTLHVLRLSNTDKLVTKVKQEIESTEIWLLIISCCVSQQGLSSQIYPRTTQLGPVTENTPCHAVGAPVRASYGWSRCLIWK